MLSLEYCQRMKSIILVHGAWHGGWVWHQVADALREMGHTVTTPTLTGLGERRQGFRGAASPNQQKEQQPEHACVSKFC